MKKKMFFYFILLVFSLGSFPKTFESEVTETFSLQNSIDIRISIENYQKKNGCTPLILSFGDLNLSLWMHRDGQVTEFPKKENSIFIINIESEYILLDSIYYSFFIYEENNIRTRIKLIKEQEPVMLKIHPYNNRLSFYIGRSKLNIGSIKVKINDWYSGISTIKFISQSVFTYSDFLLEKNNRIIYSVDYRLNKTQLRRDPWGKKPLSLGDKK